MLISKCKIHEMETIKFWCTDCEIGICHSCIPLFHDHHTLKTYRKHLHEQLAACIDKEEKRLQFIQVLSEEVIRECAAKIKFHEEEAEVYRQRDQLLHNNQDRHKYLIETCREVRMFVDDFNCNIDLGLVESFLERHSYIMEKIATDTLHNLQTVGSFHFVATFERHKYFIGCKTSWTGGTEFCFHDNYFKIDLVSKSNSNRHAIYITWEFKGQNKDNVEQFFFSGEVGLHSEKYGEETIPFAAFNALANEKILTCEVLVPQWEKSVGEFKFLPKKVGTKKDVLKIKWSLRFGHAA